MFAHAYLNLLKSKSTPRMTNEFFLFISVGETPTDSETSRIHE